MTQIDRHIIYYSLLLLFLISCMQGCGNKESATDPAKQKRLTSVADENITATQKGISEDDATGKIEAFLMTNPDNYEAYYNLGYLYEEKFMLKDALDAYRKASGLNPSSEEPLIGQGRILSKSKEYDKAILLFENAIAINPERMEIYYYLGNAYVKTGKPDDAVLLWQKAIEKNQDTSNIHYLKGLIYKNKGEFENAEAFLKKALEINPEFVAVHKVLEDLYSAKEMYGEAYHHAEIYRNKFNPLLEITLPGEERTTVEERRFTGEEPAAVSLENNILWSALAGPAGTSQTDVTSVEPGQTKAVMIRDINDALNLSGKTRMLSMLMTNLYGVQVLKDYPAVKKKLAEKELIDAKRTISEIYNELLMYTPVADSNELTKTVNSAQANWSQLEKVLSQAPVQDRFSDVLDASDKLLEENEMMTSYMESLSPVPLSEIITIAGRQRMYSQKLLRDYLAASMGVDKEYRIDSMLDAAVEFESTMLALEGVSENTSEIKGLINSITKMEWRKVYKAATECIESNGTKFNVPLMVKFCDTLLDKTDRLTKLYTEVSLNSGKAEIDLQEPKVLTQKKKEKSITEIDEVEVLKAAAVQPQLELESLPDKSETYLTYEEVNKVLDNGRPRTYTDNKFEVKTINSDKVVNDQATGLMWQQAGSSQITFRDAEAYVVQLNGEQFAGYSDWRLPTLLEALTLLEQSKKKVDTPGDPFLYIEEEFGALQERIWTSDPYNASFVWGVDFVNGGCSYYNSSFKNCVRAVR
ncbi:MAG: tetratricopeptide repeat protein [Candidatus Scalindua sp.]|nr:tetratricopeptide repeat protein [Candidatus Scalindua sp.]